jgi:hypothetical protein
MATPADVVAAAVELVRDWQDEARGSAPPPDGIEVT